MIAALSLIALILTASRVHSNWLAFLDYCGEQEDGVSVERIEMARL
jgi:hypothetical protein